MLRTYRVNAGTAFYVGYDDRYRQASDHPVVHPTTAHAADEPRDLHEAPGLCSGFLTFSNGCP